MIDAKLLRENPDVVRAALTKRGESTDLVDQVLAADGDRRSSIAAFESLRAEQKGLGKQVAQAKGDERAALLERTKTLSAEVKATEAAANEAEARFDQLSRDLPNLVSDEAPVGGEKDFVVVEEIGKPRDFAAEGFEPRDHLELGELLGAIDMERGAKISGARFYFLKGVGALLQLGMLQLAIAQAVENGFTPMITPTLVKPEVMGGTGYLNAHDDVYRLDEPELYLVGTSEVPLAGYHMDEIIDVSNGPVRYAGWSSCYRREAGSHGKDTRGIIRVHQFDKVEMFSYCNLEDAAAEHQRLLGWEKEMLDKMELAYRVIDTATGDLGTSAYRKFDCEAWVPTQGAYRELTSTSNCTDYQARRLNIRHRDEDGKTRAVATLNGTLATTRWLVAILETHQQADGSVRVPAALRPYVGGRDVLEPVARVTDGWRPKAVALDIDGTLIDHDERISPAVIDAVRRTAAQVPVILATGRAYHTTRPVAELLGLPDGFVVASNGARTVRYPSGTAIDERTFDPTTVIASVRKHAPNARMAVEEHDDGAHGYRVTAPFPDGDLGKQAVVRVVPDAELAPEPVTRLIIRDPDASEADFVQLAERLGLHGVSYFVGWTAWLDIAPEGVDKIDRA